MLLLPRLIDCCSIIQSFWKFLLHFYKCNSFSKCRNLQKDLSESQQQCHIKDHNLEKTKKNKNMRKKWKAKKNAASMAEQYENELQESRASRQSAAPKRQNQLL